MGSTPLHSLRPALHQHDAPTGSHNLDGTQVTGLHLPTRPGLPQFGACLCACACASWGGDSEGFEALSYC